MMKINMKEIFLSFRPEYFKPLLYGIKKYEYRRRFCDCETKAYLYLSGKSRKVVGVMELGRPIRLDLTKDNYLNYSETLKRVNKYIGSGVIFAIPIKSLALFSSPITLESLRNEIPNFMPPQMYYVLDNNIKLKEILERQVLNAPLFNHPHNTIYYDNLAMSVSELEKTSEFLELDNKYREKYRNLN